MKHREVIPTWFVLSMLMGISVNVLASLTTNLTIGLMRSVSAFAVTVREHDVALRPYYWAITYPGTTAAIAMYLWPIVAYFRGGTDRPAPLKVQRRVVNGTLVVCSMAFLPWLLSALLFPSITIYRFGRWSPDLTSQQVLSPLVNGFLAAATMYLILDWILRVMVVPKVFPGGRLADVPGTLALGVRARLLVFLIAVAFAPLFTVLGLIRAAAARLDAGVSLETIIPTLTRASETTFTVYIALGMALTLLLARTLTRPLATVAAALRRVQAGDLNVRLQTTSSDEVGVLEDGVNATVAAFQEKERILQTFGRVVDPAVRDRLLSGDLPVGGEMRAASILFCDLRGYTTIAERTTPRAVVATLNEFFSIMTAWVRDCGGFVDKFIGDAMLVVFGLFDNDNQATSRGAAAAIRCALGMHDRLAVLNAHRGTDGQAPLEMSVGIHTGDVLAGTIGAEDRHEYTVIGDTVNVAARLQQLCTERGYRLLVSETTYELAASSGGRAEMTRIDAVYLRGRSAATEVFGVV